MIGKSFEFNGQTISTTTADFRVGLDVVQWKALDVSDEQQNVQGYHGIKLSPTFARGRRITLEGIILADDQVGSSKGIDYLEDLFALQSNPVYTELLPFIVTDEQDRRWVLNCKIKEPLSIDIGDNDWMSGSNRRWRVVLQSEDPRYYSDIFEQVTGAEGYFGGLKLGAKLGAKLDEYYNSIQLYTHGNIETPLKITITATGNINKPIMIRNVTTGAMFSLNIDATLGDVIVIDSITQTATLNGVNTLANRVEGSSWPKAKNTTVLSIYDTDGGLFTSDFDVSVQFYDALL